MIPVRVQTLVVTSAPGPSILVLCPVESCETAGVRRIVPIWMGIAEATQMSIALDKKKLARPMTHDLFLDAVTALDATVDHVLINDVKGQIFFARLTLRQHGRLIDLDARPSDALSLAIREDAPIYIEESVLDQGSFPYLFKSAQPDETEIAEFHTFVEGIAPEDFQQNH